MVLGALSRVQEQAEHKPVMDIDNGLVGNELCLSLCESTKDFVGVTGLN